MNGYGFFLFNLKLTDTEYMTLNDYLSTRSYLSGFSPTTSDSFFLKTIAKNKNVTLFKYTHVNRWLAHMRSFSDDEQLSFPPANDELLSELVTILSKTSLDNKVNCSIFVLKC